MKQVNDCHIPHKAFLVRKQIMLAGGERFVFFLQCLQLETEL